MPDTREYEKLTDLAQDLARLQQKSADANVEADRELLSLAMDRAKTIRGLNEEQRNFLRGAAAQQLFLSKENLEIEQRVLQTKISQTRQGDDRTALERRLETNRAILSLTDQRLGSLEEQASILGTEEGSLLNIEDINKDILVIQIEKETLQQNLAGLATKERGEYELTLDILTKTLNIQKDQAEAEERRRQEAEQGDKIFGISTKTIQRRAEEIRATIMSWPVLLGATLTVGLRTFETLRKGAQLGIGQTFSLVDEGISGWAKSLSTGVVVTTEEAAAAVASLANEFGRTDLITGELIKKQLRLTTLYGLGNDQSAALLELLEVVGHHSEDFTSSSLQFMENLARANDIPIGSLMSDVASAASSFAISSEESLNNLIQSVAQAKRLGLDINKVVNFAETSVMNPDNFIQNIARLRQFGFQIADPIGLLALANDPSRQAELVDEIVNTFTSTGRDLASVSRVERQLLEQTFGVDFEQIRTVAARAAAGAGALAPAEAGEITGARDLAQNLAASTLRFVRDVDLSSLALNALAAAAAVKAIGGVGGRVTSLLAGGGLAGGGLARLARGAGTIGAIGGGAALAGGDVMALARGQGGARNVGGLAGSIVGGLAPALIGRIAGVTLGAFGGPVGIAVGSIVGNLAGKAIGGLFQRKETEHTATAAGAAAAAEQRAAAAAGAEQIIVLDTASLERKVDELIEAVRTAPPIQMDTTRVTTALRRGEQRMTHTAA